MSKICNNCGNAVDDSVNFCPYCKSQSFRNLNEITTPDNSLVHRLFYWNYDGGYVLSKSKVSGIAAFLLFSVIALGSGAPGTIIIFAFIIGGLIFMIGFALHQLVSFPSKAQISHNDYGLIQDILHLLFFWQNSEGAFVVSKTKIISFMVFLLFASIAAVSPFNTSLFVCIVIGLLFEIPVFLIGFVVHKLTNPNPKGKVKEISKPKEIKQVHKEEKPAVVQKPTSDTIPEFVKYKNQVNELNREFKTKEKSTRELIEKRFAPPQLTYDKFISVVDKSSTLFKTQALSCLSIINLASESSPRLENEIKSKINILKSLIDKLDDLQNELVLTMDDSNDDEINNIFDEMQDLISSVKDYE